MNTKPSLKFSDLPWQSHFVESLPGDKGPANYTRTVHDVCYSEVKPTPVKSPKLIGWSDSLGSELGILKPTPDDTSSIELLAGNRVLPKMRPFAARYAGHQFGNWAGQLGDGRAITLGEVTGPDAGRFEYQLKGAGPTPYSRRADGRAVLRSSIREFLCSEAMHHLGVPTTRALSLISTGDSVVRDLFYDGNPKAEPGAIVCRVAPSFLRFGNFQVLAAYREFELLKKLADYAIAEHFPTIDLQAPDVYGQLLDEVARRTAVMIAHWMTVGFVHGVMNTDNMSILGLTIDYGPYGWLEPYDPHWTPNTTDNERRRYQFGQQPAVALWNLARFGEALLPLLSHSEANSEANSGTQSRMNAGKNLDNIDEKQGEARIHASLEIYRDTFEKSYGSKLSQKLGFSSIESEADRTLVGDLFTLLQSSETDFTLFFRGLSDWKVEDKKAPNTVTQWERMFLELITPAFYSEAPLSPELRKKWTQWLIRYSQKLQQEGSEDSTRSLRMKQVNPKYVLRNYLAQTAIQAAERGDLSAMERLMGVLKTPYDELPADSDLAQKRPDWARNAPGCSALSCSS